MLTETRLPNLLHRGKVRDTYPLGDDRLLMVATDRISAFDVVLPTGIPDKGLVLNRMSAFWFETTRNVVPNHFLALADAQNAASWTGDEELMATLPPEVARRAMVVKRAERIDIECIVRGYITGSAWAEYRRQETVSGQSMPAGLEEGRAFPEPLFTPTTKAEEGHDQNMSSQEVNDMVGAGLARQLEEASKAVYNFAHGYAREKGVIPGGHQDGVRSNRRPAHLDRRAPNPGF